MEGICQCAFFPPEAINIFSGDSSRTQKATAGNLTHGLQWVKRKKKGKYFYIAEGKLGYDTENQDSQGERQQASLSWTE